MYSAVYCNIYFEISSSIPEETGAISYGLI